MIKYTTLKHDDKGIATWDAFLGVVLQVAQTREIWKKGDLVADTLKAVNIPDNILNLRYPSKYHDLIIENRVSWAISYLTSADFLRRIKRATYTITARGIEVSKEFGTSLTKMTVLNEPAFKKNSVQKEENKDQEAKNHQELGDQDVQDWVDSSIEQVQSVLLTEMTKMNPYKFENLMVQLLTAMGYQGNDGQSLVTSKSNDGGIDGVINQDPLGLQQVYIQVKRYAPSNSVGRPEIAAFAGSIKLRHTDRGVFITTSSFTKGAIEAAKDLNIVLVNGDMLTNLMIKYRIGVEIKQQFTTYKIDRDCFE